MSEKKKICRKDSCGKPFIEDRKEKSKLCHNCNKQAKTLSSSISKTKKALAEASSPDKTKVLKEKLVLLETKRKVFSPNKDEVRRLSKELEELQISPAAVTAAAVATAAGAAATAAGAAATAAADAANDANDAKCFVNVDPTRENITKALEEAKIHAATARAFLKQVTTSVREADDCVDALEKRLKDLKP